MRVSRSLLAAAALVLGTTASSTAYEPPVVAPGGTWERPVFLSNPSNQPRTIRARVRVRGHRYWGSPEQRAVRGGWVVLPPVHLAPGENAVVPVEIPLPDTAPVVLTMEIRRRDGRRSPLANGYETAFLEEPGGLPPAPLDGEIPFRLVAGGMAKYDAFDPVVTGGQVARDDAAWEALRSRLGFLPPAAWGLPPGDGYEHAYYGDGRAPFASAQAPDLDTETLLVIRTPSSGRLSRHRQLRIRSIRAVADGTLECRYSYRFRDPPESPYGYTLQIIHEGSFLLVAIPRTDAPIVFRRMR